MEALAPTSRRKRCKLCDATARVNGYCGKHEPVERQLASLRATIGRTERRLAGGALNPVEREMLERLVLQCEARMAVVSGDVAAVRMNCRTVD